MRRFWEKYITGRQMEGQTRIQMTLSQGRCYINLTFILNYPHLPACLISPRNTSSITCQFFAWLGMPDRTQLKVSDYLQDKNLTFWLTPSRDIDESEILLNTDNQIIS